MNQDVLVRFLFNQRDVRGEIDAFSKSAAEIASGSLDLSARTESQASSLEETAASMEQLSGTVKHTAETAVQVSQQGHHSASIATEGGAAVHKVEAIMQTIDASSTKVQDIMTAQVFTVTPKTSTDDCMALMSQNKIRHLPVVEGSKVLGMVSIRDLMDNIIKDRELTITQLQNYIAS